MIVVVQLGCDDRPGLRMLTSEFNLILCPYVWSPVRSTANTWGNQKLRLRLCPAPTSRFLLSTQLANSNISASRCKFPFTPYGGNWLVLSSMSVIHLLFRNQIAFVSVFLFARQVHSIWYVSRRGFYSSTMSPPPMLQSTTSQATSTNHGSPNSTKPDIVMRSFGKDVNLMTMLMKVDGWPLVSYAMP